MALHGKTYYFDFMKPEVYQPDNICYGLTTDRDPSLKELIIKIFKQIDSLSIEIKNELMNAKYDNKLINLLGKLNLTYWRAVNKLLNEV